MKLPIFSDSFIEFLNNIKKESRIARLIISVIQMHNDGFKNMLPRILTTDNVNYITYRSDGNISFLPTGKEHVVNDDNTWSRTNRQSGKPARIMRKLFTDKMLSLLNEQDFEIFNNYYKCKFNTTGYRLELLDNTQIAEVYDMTLESGSSSLNNSCMNGKSDYLDIYTYCKDLKILALFNQNNHLAGRALVWTIIDEEIDGSKIILMDRVYVTQDYLYDLFIEHATSNKWWYKQDYKSMHNKTAFINSEGNVLYRKFKIYTATDFDTYPYIDTFQYGDDGFLTNKGDKYHFSKVIKLQKPTRDADLIWSQIAQQYGKLCEKAEKYKKCGIIFNELTPDTIVQTSMFSEDVMLVQVPVNQTQDWEMRQEYITQKYTTSWDEIPKVFV